MEHDAGCPRTGRTARSRADAYRRHLDDNVRAADRRRRRRLLRVDARAEAEAAAADAYAQPEDEDRRRGDDANDGPRAQVVAAWSRARRRRSRVHKAGVHAEGVRGYDRPGGDDDGEDDGKDDFAACFHGEARSGAEC